MLRSPLVCAGLCFATLLGTYAIGCSSSTDEPPIDQTGKVPPGPPDGAPQASGPGQAFAVSKLYLGGTDRTGSPNPAAWKNLGYNLDGKVSSADSTDLCQPNAGGTKSSIYPDGTDGVDNAFGKLLWPIITGLASDAEQSVNESIADGSFTILLDLTNVSDEPNLLGVLTKLYAGQELGSVPANDGNDEWPVSPELLENPMDIGSAKVQFPESYVNSGTWVSGTKGSIDLAVNVQGFDLTLSITNAVITMDLASGLGSADNGIIAGVIEVEPLIEELRNIAGSFDESLCGGTTFDSIADQIRQASDILADGSQDPGRTCDSISIGLGFDAFAAKLGPVGPPAMPGEDPCNTGGAGGTGGTGGMGTGAGGMGTGGTGGGGGN